MIIRGILFIMFICGEYAFGQQPTAVAQPISMDSLFAAKERESIGKKFPGFTAKLTNGKIINSDTTKGKVVFINFWFEACPPCVAELSALNELYTRFAKNKSFMFLSFTFDAAGNLDRLNRKFHLRYPVVFTDRQECYRLNQNNGFPTSIILDKNGLIADLFTSGDTDKNKARHFITSTVYNSIEKQLIK